MVKGKEVLIKLKNFSCLFSYFKIYSNCKKRFALKKKINEV